MFQLVKSKVNALEVVEALSGVTLKPCGENTYTTDDDICPTCGHADCFKIKYTGENSDTILRCFSEDQTWDIISWVGQVKEINNGESARLLAKTYSIDLPKDYSPVQEIFNLAAEYYHVSLMEGAPSAALMGKTPLEFQERSRGHDAGTLIKMRVGWSDGKLAEYLRSVGVTEEMLVESGLVGRKGKDYLPADCFIYPHFIRGRVSHFTFKDPLKKKEFQLPNKFKLNGHVIYNSDSLKREGPVIVVEGENDTLSSMEAEFGAEEEVWPGAVLCCNGSISASQMEWMLLHLAGRDVITIFDSDEAGDKYRAKFFKAAKTFGSLVQVKISNGVKDIDEYLKAGGDLAEVIRTDRVEEEELKEACIGDVVDSVDGLFEKSGAYYKVRYGRDGEPFDAKLSNFTILLKNIYIQNSAREREIVVIREDGRHSPAIKIPSEAKVSLKPFKTLMANAIDASFYGREEDLAAMWELVYKRSTERVVHIPENVGRCDDLNGWIFGDCFVSKDGASYTPDKDGVIWIAGNESGVKPGGFITSTKGDASNNGLPKIRTILTSEDREQLIGDFLTNMSANLGNPGMALTIMAWCWANVHSDEIFPIMGGFPILYLWGDKHQGKTTFNKWILGIFNLEDTGYHTVNNLNSGVAFIRKMAYYSSLPMLIDELRNDRESEKWYGHFRAWFNRDSKKISAKDSFGVIEIPIKANLLLSGQSNIPDPATRSRYIPIRFPKIGRDMVKSYAWFEANKIDFGAIGYHWVVNHNQISPEMIKTEAEALNKILREQGASPRTSMLWALIGVFANRLAEKYMPEFDYNAYVAEAAKEDVDQQSEDDTLSFFWEMIEGMQIGDRPAITGDHLRRDEDILYFWFAEAFRACSRETRYGDKDTFSKRAVLELLKEEPYYVGEERTKMGMSDTIRRVVKLDLTRAPEVLKRIADCLG